MHPISNFRKDRHRNGGKTADIAQYVERFNRREFTVVKGALSEEHADALREKVLEGFEGPEDGYGRHIRTKMFEQGNIFVKLLEQRPVIDIAEALLGKSGHMFAMNALHTVKGEGAHEIAGTPTSIAAGDVYLISPGVSHAYRIRRSIMVYNVIFAEDLIRNELALLAGDESFFGFFYVEPFLRRTSPQRPYLNVRRSDRVRLRQMIETLIEEDRERRPGYRVFIKAQLIQVLIFLSRCFAAGERPLTLDAGDEAEMIRRVCDFIELHRAQPLTLEQVSAMCGLGTTVFSRSLRGTPAAPSSSTGTASASSRPAGICAKRR